MADATAPVRLRVAAVVGLVAAVAASGAVLDRLGPVAPAAARPSVGPSGAWFCPHGGGSGWQGWVVLTNPGRDPVRVRLTSFGPDRPPRSSSFVVEAARQVYREVPAEEPGAATEVEYFGGWVAAAAVVRSGEDGPGGFAAERCPAAPHPAWFLPDGTTARGQTSFAVVMNPFAADAAVEVVIRTEGRLIRPGALNPFVVPAGRSAAISLNAFALQGPRERTVAVEVRQRIGRVVVGGLGLSPEGVRAEAGLPLLRERWTMATAGVEAWALPALNPGDLPATITVLRQTADEQLAVEDLSEVTLGEGTVQTYEIPVPDQSGAVIESTNEVPFAATARVEAGDDVATVNGGARGYRRWVVLPGLPPDGGTSFLAIANPGLSPARVEVTLIGEGGRIVVAGVAPVAVPGGRAVVLPLPVSPDGRPATALVEATGGTIVAATASYAAGGDGFAATLGQPVVD